MHSTVEVAGCRLAYSVVGQGPPVLFIQGVATPGQGWQPQIDALQSDFRCMSFDNRGIGASGPASAEFTVAQLADDALAVLDACGVESAHVVGHSLGGLIALQLALAQRQRVRSLALLCSFANGRRVGPLSLKLAWYGLGSRVGPRWLRRRAFLHLILPSALLHARNRNQLAQEYGGYFGRDLAVTPAITSRQLAAMRACDLTPRLSELAGFPTFILSADEDPIATPDLGRAIASGIAGAQFHLAASASHALPLHRPEEVNGLLRQHWQRLAAQSGGPSPN